MRLLCDYSEEVQCVLVAEKKVEPLAVEALLASLQHRGIETSVLNPSDVKVVLDAETGASVIPDVSPKAVVLHRNVMAEIDLLKIAFGMWRQTSTKILNDFESSLNARNKFVAAVNLQMAGIPVSSTLAFSAQSILNFPLQGEFVIKPVRGARGVGVEKRETINDWVEPVEIMPNSYRPFWIAQPVVGANTYDRRAFVVDGVCVALMRREPSGDEWRATVPLGADCVAEDPNGVLGKLAELAVGTLKLDFASVDILDSDNGPVINEVDPWGGFTALSKATGVDVAGKIADLVERRGLASH